MENKKIIVTCSLCIAGIIALGLIISQSMKQNAIKEQLQMKIDQENAILLEEKTKEEALVKKENLNKFSLNLCLDAAETAYWDYMELNGTGKRDTAVKAPTYVWDNAKDDKKTEIDNCYRKYGK